MAKKTQKKTEKTWRDCKQHMENSTKYPHIPGHPKTQKTAKKAK